ncbi:hypothetical protein [Lachnoclostridium phytofermentans]|uniref:hypothetical protein n=1 Tax=Lachnoclostridium phytofermentans TaxID=66219 RepID=UPI001F6234BD|nr:hypothetical protein [Lachnoclostridium phytofermentans]
MYQISNEKFGLFLDQTRKEKNLTQKELAELLRFYYLKIKITFFAYLAIFDLQYISLII